jgi:hypothetical protein
MSAESEVLHRIIEGDLGEADRLLREFLPGELRELQNSVEILDTAVRDALAYVRTAALPANAIDRCATPGHVHVRPQSISTENCCTIIGRTVVPFAESEGNTDG